MAGFSQNITWGVVSCHNITPMLTSDGMMSKRVKGIARVKCTLGPMGRVHQATTSWQLDVLVDQGVNPTPVMGRLTAWRMHVVRKLKVIVLSAGEEASNSRLNMWVSNVQESSIWKTEGAERRDLICSALSGGTTELKPTTLTAEQSRGDDLFGNQSQLRKWKI